MSEGVAKVYATDIVLTALMCAPRSTLPWDMVVHKRGGNLFLDARAGGQLDTLTVAETAPDAVPDEKDNINGIQQLSAEATAINHNFAQQVLQHGGPKMRPEGAQPNPFVGGEGAEPNATAATAYRYRKWSIGEGMDVLVRCEVDGALSFKGQDVLLAVRTLNEFDPKFTGARLRPLSLFGGVLAEWGCCRVAPCGQEREVVPSTCLLTLAWCAWVPFPSRRAPPGLKAAHSAQTPGRPPALFAHPPRAHAAPRAQASTGARSSSRSAARCWRPS